MSKNNYPRYPCLLPASYGQGVYEIKPDWVAPQPVPLQGEKDEDYEWGDPEGTTPKQQNVIPLVKAGPNCSHYLAPDETMEQCPYDPGHLVLAHRFMRHLEKCRTNYITQRQARGKRIKMDICLYDRTHHVRSDEMTKHMEICPAAKKYIAEIARIENGPDPEVPVKVEMPVKTKDEDKPKKKKKPPRLAMVFDSDDEDVKPDMKEENWELTAEPGKPYDPVEQLAMDGTMHFCPQGMNKSEKKEFRANEKKRHELIEEQKLLMNAVVKRKDLLLPTARPERPAQMEARLEREKYEDARLAEVEADLEERGRIFKEYLYRTRPNPHWFGPAPEPM